MACDTKSALFMYSLHKTLSSSIDNEVPILKDSFEHAPKSGDLFGAINAEPQDKNADHTAKPNSCPE